MAHKVVTGEVRLSYVNLFEPRAIVEGGALKYGVSILISKDDKAQLKQIQDVIDKIIKEEQGILKGTKGLKLPMRDGDEKDAEGYEDHMFISVSSKDKPLVVDENRQDILSPREIYSGCFGRVSMNFYAYNKAGNKGIGVALNSVQKLSDGEPLGGGTYTKESVEEDFGDDLL
jgi:hypothetical protein